MRRNEYEPTGYDEASLAEHGERIAGRLRLNVEQVLVLVPELRNSLATIVIALGEAQDGGTRFTQEGVEDIKNSVARIRALANALANR